MGVGEFTALYIPQKRGFTDQEVKTSVWPSLRHLKPYFLQPSLCLQPLNPQVVPKEYETFWKWKGMI